MRKIQFDDKGLVPAIIQDAVSKEVLTLAYMNKQSLEKTIETRQTWLYSRSRKELWHKGATSGHTQEVLDIRYDCDEDALVVLVVPNGPACHKGNYTCFGESLLLEEPFTTDDRFAIVNALEATIATREMERPKDAYTTYLFTEGVDKILKKVGEEASEVIIAAKNRDAEELKWEVADLFYHVLVLLREQKLPLDEVLAVLEERHGK